MDTCDLNVVASWTTFIVIPATHEKAESQSTTHIELACEQATDLI
ncbi:hypothetical protein VCR29J2_70131 [Vibrio coralliirubri]|nr:hypothetical protein VCR29J2_70131 [Vibrio coralliirubri]